MSERERFERYARARSLPLDRMDDGRYRNMHANEAWLAWQAACPEGWQCVPKKITAETGHKYALMGEFSESITLKCPECEDLGGTDEDCDICGGDGEYEQDVPIEWSTIKRIHDAIVAASPKPEDV